MKRVEIANGVQVLVVDDADAVRFTAALDAASAAVLALSEVVMALGGERRAEEHRGTRTDTDGHGRTRTSATPPHRHTATPPHGHTSTLPAGGEKKCEACGAAFVPNWKRKDQRFCKGTECIKARGRAKAMARYRARTGSTGAHPVTACRNCGAPRASTPWPKRGALCRECDHKRAMGKIPKVGQGNRAARMAPVAPRPAEGAETLKFTWKDRIREAAEKASAEIAARRGSSESED